jgi:hypothetical protein
MTNFFPAAYCPNNRSFRLSFAWQWIGATLCGFSLSLLWVEVGQRGELNIIETAIGAMIVGLFQALILSKFFSHTWLWIFVNLLAWTVLSGSGFGSLGWMTPHTEIFPVRLIFGLIFGAIGGIWIGLWQWLVLKAYFQQAWRWIGISFLSWMIALPLGWIIGGILRVVTKLFIGEVIGLMITWTTVGIITALGLMGLLKINSLQ